MPVITPHHDAAAPTPGRLRATSAVFLRAAMRWLAAIALLAVGTHALAQQQDPPGRVGYLGDRQGTLSFSPAGDDSWYDVAPNRPITTGDRLWTDRAARAEVQLGATTLRMDEQTDVAFAELDDDTLRLTTNQGSLQLRVHELRNGERIEVGTGNTAVVVDAPGDYRIDADPANGTTRVAVANGQATLFGDNGESTALASRQQLTVSGRSLAALQGAPARSNTAFDRWVAERSRLEERSVSARYVPRELAGYQQLDAYGDWQDSPDYGAVWYPRNVDADWAPYRDGQWVDIAPWGWTWVDAAPWGFAPSHYGRWARIGPRWGWVPGRAQARPVYSPALVGFVGGGGAASVAIGNGRNGIGWFPLAPGEAWRPGFRASQRYVDDVNRAVIANRRSAEREAFYANQRAPGAVTVVPTDVFGRGPFGRRDVVRLPPEHLAGIPASAALPLPLRDELRGRGGFGRPAAAMPPSALHGGPGPLPWGSPQQAAQPMQQRQIQQAQQQELQRQAIQAQQMQQMQQAQQQQQMQREAWRRQQGQPQPYAGGGNDFDAQRRMFEQRGQQAQQAQQWQLQQQMQQQQQQQQALRQQQQMQQQMQQAQQQQALRQQQEAQARAIQAQQLQMQQQQQLQQQQMQQQALRAQQQQQQMQQMQQIQQQNAARQQQEMQRAMQIRQQQIQQIQRGGPARDQPSLADRP